MLTKFASSLLAALTLSLGVGFIAPVNAQTASPSPQQQPVKPVVNLSADQKAKITKIMQAAQKDILAVLTPSQQQKIKNAGNSPQNVRQVWASLDLNPEQKAKIQKISLDSREQISALLTPEQKERIRNFRPAQ